MNLTRKDGTVFSYLYFALEHAANEVLQQEILGFFAKSRLRLMLCLLMKKTGESFSQSFILRLIIARKVPRDLDRVAHGERDGSG